MSPSHRTFFETTVAAILFAPGSSFTCSGMPDSGGPGRRSLFKHDYSDAPYSTEDYAAHRIKMKNLRLQAEEMARLRITREAEQLLEEMKNLK